MSKLLRQNIGGTDYTMVGCTLTGTCSSAASDYIKTVTLADGDILSDGMTVVVAFTNGNTAGTAPASMTIYSSDQVNYFTDSGLTQPFTLAPAGCYEITYTGEGNAYTYISYPVMQVGSVSGPLCDASGNKSSGALWLEGDKVSINYSNGCFNVIPQTAGSLTVTAASSIVNGAPVRIGSTVRVLFTQDLAGAANTGLVLVYNGVNIPVMVGKNGSLGALLPFDVGGSTYKYLQAYITLEMTYDGTQFIVLGNPVVISNSDYTVYTDGSIAYSKTKVDNTFVKSLGKSVKNANGASFVTFTISDIIDISIQYSYHFKFVGISNGWTAGLAEGEIAIYGDTIQLIVDWNNPYINSITISGNQLNVAGNSNFYDCYLAITTVDNWIQTP